MTSPCILADAIGKSVRNGYESEPASSSAWVRAGPRAGFQGQQRPILGERAELAGSPRTRGVHRRAHDGRPASYAVEKFGRIVALTLGSARQRRPGAFLRIQPALGQAARRKEADSVYALFALNAAAGPDDAGRHRLVPRAATPTSAPPVPSTPRSWGAARTLLRKQTALGGGLARAGAALSHRAAGAGAPGRALMAASSRTITSAASDTVPLWIGNLDLVVEPRPRQRGRLPGRERRPDRYRRARVARGERRRADLEPGDGVHPRHPAVQVPPRVRREGVGLARSREAADHLAVASITGIPVIDLVRLARDRRCLFWSARWAAVNGSWPGGNRRRGSASGRRGRICLSDVSRSSGTSSSLSSALDGDSAPSRVELPGGSVFSTLRRRGQPASSTARSWCSTSSATWRPVSVPTRRRPRATSTRSVSASVDRIGRRTARAA